MFVRRSLFSTLALLLFASRAFSQPITVPDYNFWDPSAGTANFATATSTSAGLGSWQVPPPPNGYPAVNWYEQMGVFYNSPTFETITNLSGSQDGYLIDTPGLALSQTLSSAFQAGKSYQLTVALAGGGQTSTMPLNDPIDFGLYYMSGGSQTFIGTTEVKNDNSGWNASLGYIDHLVDYNLTIPPVGAGDPWEGQNIGVALFVPGNADNSFSFWDIDNVRVQAVPEPGSLALLLATGLSILALGRRWSSKKKTL